jgi:hypothetical protein
MTAPLPRSVRRPTALGRAGRIARRRAAVACAAVACLAGAAWGARAQTAVDSATPQRAAPADDQARAAVPFGPGERFTYDVKFGVLKVGSGSMQVAGPVEVRGRETYHTTFRVRGGTFFYKVDDRFESWIDTRTLSTLRFVEDLQEGRRDRERTFQIFPDRLTYREGDGEEQRSVANPLDQGSFIYYVRTLPLRPGDTYELNRYYRPDRNPVRIRVLRRERVSVPAGTFDAVVVQPSIRTKGIFSEGGRAEIWFSDDDERVMLQMKSQLSFGSLNLYLKSRQSGRKLSQP